MLSDAIRRYQNNALSAAEIIDELIRLAKDIKAADKRGDELKMDFRELAFYDALEVNNTAVKILGDEILKTIARELVESVRKSVTIDWTVKESVQAQMRVTVKRILKKYGYPPDDPTTGDYNISVNRVIEQAKLLGDNFSDQ